MSQADEKNCPFEITKQIKQPVNTLQLRLIQPSNFWHCFFEKKAIVKYGGDNYQTLKGELQMSNKYIFEKVSWFNPSCHLGLCSHLLMPCPIPPPPKWDGRDTKKKKKENTPKKPQTKTPQKTDKKTPHMHSGKSSLTGQQKQSYYYYY